MSERRCRRGGTHVYPRPGVRYDDGRCLKCGRPRSLLLAACQRLCPSVIRVEADPLRLTLRLYDASGDWRTISQRDLLGVEA